MAIGLDLEAPEVRLPDRYEVVNGEIVEKPPMGLYAAEIANRIRDHLTLYAHERRTGRARNDLLFRLPLDEDRARNREPDVAWISHERWPANRPLPYRGNPIDVVPELLVEVASPTDEAEALLEKASEYLRAGAKLVWLVFPRLQQVYAYTSDGAAPRVFLRTETLEGGTVLPGFAVAMADLFPEMEKEPDLDSV